MRRTKEDAAKTRANILKSAIHVFSEKGVSRASLQEIANRAHVTRGAIYWHFKNKTEIFDALHENLHRPLVEMILEEVEKDHPEPLSQLEKLSIGLLTDLAKNKEKRQTLTLFLDKCDYSGELAPYKIKHRERKTDKQKLFALYFEKAKEKGKLPPNADTAILSLAFNSYLKGLVLEYLEKPADFHIEENATRLMKLFFTQLSAKETWS